MAVLVGLAGAWGGGVPTHWSVAALTLLGAVLAHAGANLVNDYHDREADAGNAGRLTPFTGGSRLIQDGVLDARAVAAFGYALLAATVAIGTALALSGRPQLWTLGALGLALAVAYSAPPLRLSARGIGEFAIAAAWLLVVVGADVAQRGSWAPAPLAAGVPIALLVAAILLANEFPDRIADAAAGKRTLIVRLGPRRGACAYLALVASAHLWLAAAVAAGAAPPIALAGLTSAPLSLFAARQLALHGGDSPTSVLLPALRVTIAAAHLHGLLVAAALLLAAR
ncbi:MAG TPA: prenyltransferase [Burkholderiaceae bacterium]|nr:prenyltransferase [Burkholderiaceae bacterium]HRA78217.1 prenyltransferase [Burkholderiaceae bacterium]